MLHEDRFRLDDFELYQAVREFRINVYRLLRQLPVEEKDALSRQMRRAVLSVTNNIAEGHGRWQWQENSRFCRIARGSLDEVLDDLNVCLDEGYGETEQVIKLKLVAAQLIARIDGYIAYLQRSRQGATN
ncbi:MAG: four helix bundle protein [Planctomycetaceae bacterium]